MEKCKTCEQRLPPPCETCGVHTEHIGEVCPKYNPDFDPTEPKTWSADDLASQIDLAKDLNKE